jgi:hypothetical protein
MHETWLRQMHEKSAFVKNAQVGGVAADEGPGGTEG